MAEKVLHLKSLQKQYIYIYIYICIYIKHAVSILYIIATLYINVDNIFSNNFNFASLYCIYLSCCYALHMHSLHSLMTIHTNVLYISGICLLPDDGTEMADVFMR